MKRNEPIIASENPVNSIGPGFSFKNLITRIIVNTDCNAPAMIENFEAE